MPKILLISANREILPYPVFPLGVAYVATSLTEAGHSVRIFDVNCFEPESIPFALNKALEQFRPDLIGLSIRNIDNLTFPTSVSYIPEIRALIEVCRATAGDVPIILGGAGYSLFPEEALAALDADLGIVGDAEGRIARVVRVIVEYGLRNADWEKAGIGGVVYRERSNVLRTPPATASELPFPSYAPDRRGLDLAFYDREGGMGNIQTKRGCPCRCLYCTYPLLEGRRFQTRPAEAVADEIAVLLSQGVQYLYVVDNYFNALADHAEAVCRALIARGLSVPWSCFAHPAYLDEPLAALMKQAGCASVELGSDAGSTTMLESLRKDMTPEQILAASNACRGAGLPFAHYLLLGGPGETETTLAETFDLMDRCDPTAVIVMCGIRIYPGTPLEYRAREEGLLTARDPLLEPKFYISPAIRSSLLERVADAASRRPNWIVPGLGINLSPRLTRKLRDLGHKGPMWELLGKRKRAKPLTHNP